MNIQNFLLKFFTNKLLKEKQDIKIDVNYFDEGYIDSFGIFELITTIEERYQIQFSEEDFQNRDFSTIEGLSRMIEEKVNAL